MPRPLAKGTAAEEKDGKELERMRQRAKHNVERTKAVRAEVLNLYTRLIQIYKREENQRNLRIAAEMKASAEEESDESGTTLGGVAITLPEEPTGTS